ncbi:MAG TPA: prepilin-type N-terminal cleavage/methylation domain-containing protein [Kiritimatiellia bacterium]|nr:prepilin-type N-terminal cleavage/methylation domain-containing protein [Kiritimatiellia bacterium]
MKSARQSAFTLIEVLASMAVLLLITLALSRLFAEATRAYTRATTTASRAATIRAAMDMISSDLEGLAVDRRLAMLKEANIVDDNYDAICFSTTSGPRDYENGATRAYEQVIYYVTNRQDKGYTTYILSRVWRSDGSSRAAGIDSLGKQREWWNFHKYPYAGIDTTGGGYKFDRIAENVVRFDIWICSLSGENMQTDAYGIWGDYQVFSSIYDYPGFNPPQSSNVPPAYIDIYLQIASDDAMKKASALLAGSEGSSGDVKERLRAAAYAILYQDSTVYINRLAPSMGLAERLHPLPY